MISKDGLSRFEVAESMPKHKEKLTAEEAIGFGHLMFTLNLAGELTGYLNPIAKKFFEAGAEVSKRAIPVTEKTRLSTINDQMRWAKESGDEGCEIELTQPELVVFTGKLIEFGPNCEESDPVIGKVIDRLVAAGKNAVKRVDEAVEAERKLNELSGGAFTATQKAAKA